MNNAIKMTVCIQGIPGRVRHQSKKGDVWLPCQKRINMTQDAFDYFTSSEVPMGFKGVWRKLNQDQRIKYHLTQWMLREGGSSFTYNVLEE